MQMILENFGRLQSIAKSKGVQKIEFNNISKWLEVLVYSLKGSRAQKIGCKKESQIMDQPKKHRRERA